MSKKRSPRWTIEGFASALSGAASESAREVPFERRQFPDPLCIDAPEEYVDYVSPPDRATAAAMCNDCPLLDLCLANARRTRPAWGVWGGIAWAQGRQVHLLDEERRAQYLFDLAA